MNMLTKQERCTTMTDVGRTWHCRDPKAVAEWVSSSGLPEEEQTAILNPGGEK